ncbi:10360_t:CDS:2 [Ambispora gerdemannii]|uniref:10360_t:CDS:1 n=1 Tax=Ambispora gerdemannii TaxID=144530 RepID=A0A9N9DN93_9GLOM|nr:10360_t:CDS:2 [Ambispora gerdemannii]
MEYNKHRANSVNSFRGEKNPIEDDNNNAQDYEIRPQPKPYEIFKPCGSIIRTELKKIIIKPTNFAMDTYVDVHLVLMLLVVDHVICFSFNGSKDKMCIHFDDIYAVRYAEFREFEFFLKDGFKRTFYEKHKKVNIDLTSGIFNNATSIIVIPEANFPMGPFVKIENEFRNYKRSMAFTRIKLINDKDHDNQTEDNLNGCEFCVAVDFQVERYSVTIPWSINYNQLIKTLEDVSQIQIEGYNSKMYYKDTKRHNVSLLYDDDWKIAKKELRENCKVEQQEK